MKPEQIALKQAFAETIKGVGGLEAAAGFCRVGKSVLGDNQSVNRADSFPAIDVVMDLEPLARERTGWPHVLRAMARQMGFALFALPEAAPAGADLLSLLAEQSREHGDIAGSICAGLSATSEGGSKLTDAEARRIAAEIHESIHVAVAMLAELETIAREGGR